MVIGWIIEVIDANDDEDNAGDQQKRSQSSNDPDRKALRQNNDEKSKYSKHC